MESEPSPQRHCHLPAQIFSMTELGKMTFGLGQNDIVLQTTVCKGNRKTDILTTGTDGYGHVFVGVGNQEPVVFS